MQFRQIINADLMLACLPAQGVQAILDVQQSPGVTFQLIGSGGDGVTRFIQFGFDAAQSFAERGEDR